MAAQKGVTLLLKIGDGADPEVFTTLAGVRSKTVNQGATQIDITTDDDISASGVSQMTYLPGITDFSLSVDGVAKDVSVNADLIEASRSGTIQNYQVEWANVGTWQGAMFLTDFAVTGTYDGAITFTTTIRANGLVAWTRTAA